MMVVLLVVRLCAGWCLQLFGSCVQTEQGGHLTQDGVGLLEARDPLVEDGLVSLAGHTHGKDWTLIHWTQRRTHVFSF